MEEAYKKFYFPKEDYQNICDLFSLGKLRSFSKLDASGFESIKILASTEKGKFVISAHSIKSTRPKSKRSMMYEITLLKSLKGIPVQQYIKGKEGYMLEYDGFDITCYKYIEGTMPRKIDENKALQLGSFLGRFHVLGRRFKTRLIGRRQFYNLDDDVMLRMDPYAVKQTNPILKRNYAKVREGVICNRLPKVLERGPIHVDISPSNVLFKEGKLSGVLDFGNFYRDAYLIDIGKLLMFNCTNDGKIDKKLMKATISGYERYRKITLQERKLLKKAVLFAIYSHIYVDYFHTPLKIVPESYTLYLVKTFLPVADWLEKREDIL